MSAAPSDLKALEASERKARKAAETALASLPGLFREVLRAVRDVNEHSAACEALATHGVLIRPVEAELRAAPGVAEREISRRRVRRWAPIDRPDRPLRAEASNLVEITRNGAFFHDAARVAVFDFEEVTMLPSKAQGHAPPLLAYLRLPALTTHGVIFDGERAPGYATRALLAINEGLDALERDAVRLASGERPQAEPPAPETRFERISEPLEPTAAEVAAAEAVAARLKREADDRRAQAQGYHRRWVDVPSESAIEPELRGDLRPAGRGRD